MITQLHNYTEWVVSASIMKYSCICTHMVHTIKHCHTNEHYISACNKELYLAWQCSFISATVQLPVKISTC